MQYKLNFEQLCDAANIGHLRSEPTQLKGGFLHRMYGIETTSGTYAVKALNRQIMLRPRAMSDIVNGERIAAIAAEHIPALPAKQFNAEVVLEIDGQHYLIYDWVDGQSLHGEQITSEHCKQIGAALGTLHTIDFSALNMPKPAPNDEQPVDWDGYLSKGQQAGAPWADALLANIDNLYDWNRRYLAAMAHLDRQLVIGHCDIDPKNVLWRDDRPVIIDWEAAAYVNPAHEFVVHALYWSDVNEKIDEEKFNAFLQGYLSKTKFESVDWTVVMNAGLSPDWLTYSLRRSLGIEGVDAAEQRMGTDQVLWTINHLKRYAQSIPQIAGWMSQI